MSWEANILNRLGQLEQRVNDLELLASVNTELTKCNHIWHFEFRLGEPDEDQLCQKCKEITYGEWKSLQLS